MEEGVEGRVYPCKLARPHDLGSCGAALAVYPPCLQSGTNSLYPRVITVTVLKPRVLHPPCIQTAST